MVAIQIQSLQKQDERDTRDTWELRLDIQKQQKIQQHLYADIQEAEATINKYEKASIKDTMNTLKESVSKLKKEAGLTEISGKGVVFTMSPLFAENMDIQAYPKLTAPLVNMFINELNKYGATDIAIADERIVSFTPIRDVNGRLYVNNHPLPSLPVDIKVLAVNPERLLSYMEYSTIHDHFAVENISLTGSIRNVILPAYDQKINLKQIHVMDDNGMDGE